jgi:hypothetical protein
MMRLPEYRLPALGLASFILLIFALDCSAQSIADVARQERERQKNVQSKVFVQNVRTNSIDTGTPPANAAPPAPVPAPAKQTGPVDNQGRDEKYWRGAFQKARDDAKRAADRSLLLDLKLKDLNTQLLRQSDLYNRENRLGAEITTAQKELEIAQKEAAEAKQKITDLEDELRKSGGLPGWAR